MGVNLLDSFVILDYSPDGFEHISPEIRRARQLGIYQPCALPLDVDHLHGGSDLILITHGGLRYLIGHDQYINLEAGDVFIIPGGNRHRMHLSADGHFCYYGTELPATLFATLAREPELQPIASRLARVTHPLPVRLLNDQVVFQSLRNIFEEVFLVGHASDNPGQERMLNNYRELLALHVISLLHRAETMLPEHPTTARILDVQTWIDRHFDDPLTLSELAEKAQMSVAHLARLFNEIVGVSPKQYLLRRRLERAAFLLLHDAMSVSEIAQAVGFNYASNFSNAFIRFTGLSPSDYRKTFAPTAETKTP